MDVFLDPRLDDGFREHEWQACRDRPEVARAAFEGFLDERFNVVHGYDLGRVDLNFLGGLSFPQTWEFKKLQAADVLRPDAHALHARICHDAFGGDDGAFRYFVEQVGVLKEICDELLGTLLPGKPDNLMVITRFSETRMENLHYDLDRDSDSHEAFRLYINLDKAPRMWATSYSMTQLIRGGGQRLSAGITDDMPGETMLKRMATRAYGGWNQRATERLSPRHLVYIDPGDIFYIDGRCVSHQVLTGQRVLSIYARLEHSTHSGLQRTFASKLRGALAEARSVPIGSETALVNYYQPQQLTAAADVREDWSNVFGDTRTGRIRRFDDYGLRTASRGVSDG